MIFVSVVTILALILAPTSDATDVCASNCSLLAVPSTCWRKNVEWYGSASLAAFNQRVIVAAHVGAWKKRRGIPIEDPTRVDALLKNIASWNQGPITNSVVKEFFKLVIDETTKYEYEALDNPPTFSCSFYHDCGKKGYHTNCSEECSIDDEKLECWRSDINVYTRSLLVNLNQLAILERRLKDALVKEKLPPVDQKEVDERVGKLVSSNPGPLPPTSVRSVFQLLFKDTLAYVDDVNDDDGVLVTDVDPPKSDDFTCDVYPTCSGERTSTSILTIGLGVIFVLWTRH